MPRLAPVELSEYEVERLMRAFIKGKRCIDEEDALVLVKWARDVRATNVLLDMVLQGELRPVVEAGVVKLGLVEESTV